MDVFLLTWNLLVLAGVEFGFIQSPGNRLTQNVAFIIISKCIHDNVCQDRQY